MKKLTLIFGFSILNLYCGGLFAQQENTLPTTGNVGIGTLTPSSKLDVNGHVRIDSTLLIKDSVLIQKDARILENLKLGGQMYLPNIEPGIPDQVSKVIFKDPNGQVKQGGIQQLGDIIYSKTCEVDQYGNVVNPVWNNGLNKLYTDCDAVKVGVGTANPTAKLDVRGTTFTSKLAINTDPATMTGFFHMKVNLSENNASTIFKIENNERALLQLNNDGILRSREVMVNLQNPWPDYVFEKEYKLIPLPELGQYIKVNGHLPNVPTAEAVKEEGIALGEMNKILVEKIEELTLYILEQNEKMKELESRIKTLEK